MTRRWQRYSEPLAMERMKAGLCPECGASPADHGGWGGPHCSLTDTGAAGRIYQFEQDQITEPVTPSVDLDTQTEREQWKALAEADSLHLLPPEALITSIKYLSEKLLSLTEKDDG